MQALMAVRMQNGAPRPMKMGTIASPWRYDAEALTTPSTGNSAAACDFALRPVGVSRAAPPPSVPVRRDRPQCDIAHQPDLGHIPSVDERFCNERELSPAQFGLRRGLAHPKGRAQSDVSPSVTTSRNDALR